MHKSQAWLGQYYRFDAAHNLWQGEEEILSSPSPGSDIEERLVRIVHGTFDRSSTSLEFEAVANDATLDDHFSPRRANLLRPLAALLHGTVLEIGAASGALTRFLGENATEVVAVEEDAALAAVAAARCADLSNVSVVVDRFSNLPASPGFGVVTLIGLPCPARPQQWGQDSILSRITRARSFLRPGGILILTIENSNGFDRSGVMVERPSLTNAGSIDDPAVASARTELERHLSEAGMPNQQWWFPQPDWKLPTSMVSDRAIGHETEFLMESMATAHATRWKKGRSFSVDRTLAPIFQTPHWPDFVSSFLVVSSDAPLPEHDILAVHYGPRSEAGGAVGARHSERPGMVIIQRRRSTALPIDAAASPDGAFSVSRSLHDDLVAIVGKAGWTLDDWSGWAEAWLEAVLRAAKLPTQPLPPPTTSLPGHFVDAVPRRMIVGDDGVTRFQGSEWQLERPFEIGFLFYRGLFDSLDALTDCAEPKTGVPLGKMALVQHVLRSIGWQMTAGDIRRHVEFEGQIEAEFAGGGERALSTLHDPILVRAGAAIAVRRTEAALARDLAQSEAKVANLIEKLEAIEDERQTVLSYMAQIELELDQERQANREAQREIEAITAAGEYLLRHLRRAYSKPWYPVEQGLKRSGLRLLLMLEPLMPSRSVRRFRSSLQKRRPARFQLEWEMARALPKGFLSHAQPHAEEEHDIALIGASGLFDAAFYAGTAEARAMGISPVAHYVRYGEARGLAPSAAFDPSFYGRLYPDLLERRLHHYLMFGRHEGRAAIPTALGMAFPQGKIDPDRQTLIILGHEASRTGAPILGWNIVRTIRRKYNVVVVLQRPGALVSAFEQAANVTIQLPGSFKPHEAEFEELAKALVTHYKPQYVIANSLETREIVPAFERSDIPVVALVHEFSSSYRPIGLLKPLLENASQVVFPAQVVADAALNDHQHILPRRYTILPQGRSELPIDTANHQKGGTAPDPRILRRPGLPEHADAASLPVRDGTLFVVGMGTITIRKGVDAFISAAADVLRRRPDIKIKFAWAGEAFNYDQAYVDFIEAQIERSGLRERFDFLGAFSDMDPLYERTDILVLSSRLDPLPNVSIDCAARGIPVLCFENASGMSEILLKRQDTSKLVVPYLDSAALAGRIIDLATDQELRGRLSKAMREIAETTFDMNTYVASIDMLAQASLRSVRQSELDYKTIRASGTFNGRLYQRGMAAPVGEDEALRLYLKASRNAVPRAKANSGVFVRRPVEGFHPLVYAAENPAYGEQTGEDPLAHFLRSGGPAGPWQHKVIAPRGNTIWAARASKIAIHGHFDDADLLPEFIDRLSQSRTPHDLLITTRNAYSRAEIDRMLATLGKTRNVLVTPNRGCHLGPLFSAFTPERILSYDLIGHFHGGTSQETSATRDNAERTLLWEHLIGGRYPMMDEVVAAFDADPRLGLVFAEEATLPDWGDNRPIAESLAAKIGIPLSDHFDFPVGGMFWARPSALAPIFDLNLSWDDYPEEPLPVDGTLLRVLERILPFAAKKAGYEYATTYVRDQEN